MARLADQVVVLNAGYCEFQGDLQAGLKMFKNNSSLKIEAIVKEHDRNKPRTG